MRMRVGSNQIKSEYRVISVANETLYELSYTRLTGKRRNKCDNNPLATFFTHANMLAGERATSQLYFLSGSSCAHARSGFSGAASRFYFRVHAIQ